MGIVDVLWLLWESILSRIKIFTGRPLKTEATDGGVVSNLDIKSNKTRNLISKVETVTGSKKCPSGVGQRSPALCAARGGGVIRGDRIHVGVIDGDLNASVCVTKS